MRLYNAHDDEQPEQYHPSTADERWYSRQVWKFDRTARLIDLLDRARRMREDLFNQRCTTRAAATAATLLARAEVLEVRFRRLSSLARQARREQRAMERRAAEEAAVEAMVREHDRDYPAWLDVIGLGRPDDRDMANVGAVG